MGPDENSGDPAFDTEKVLYGYIFSLVAENIQ